MAAAAEVLADMAQRKRPVADALKDWGLSHRFAGSGDRAAIGNLVYDALRKKLSLGFRIGDEAPIALICAVLLDSWGETEATLRAKLGDDRFAPELPDAGKFAHFRDTSLAGAPLHVQSDIPEWTMPLLGDLFGSDLVEECKAMTGRPPVDMRVNRLLATPEKVTGDLPRDLMVMPYPGVADALRIKAGDKDYRQPNIQAEPGFQKGWFEIQDIGSQIVALLSGVKPSENVLDFCAGGGGKTLALASAMGNSGQVHATDSDKARLAPIFERLKRAETRNVQVHGARSDLTHLEGQMDCVLIDAPCTGAGTWRRRPDAKWRLSQNQLDQRVQEQAGILDNVRRFVKPGGRIAYITCSVFEAENDAQSARFLNGNADYSALPAEQLLADHLPELPSSKIRKTTHGLMLTPLTSETDGFYLSVLQKR